MANMLNVGLMISLGVPQLTRLLSVSLFSILGFVLAAYALKTLGRLPEVSPIGRGGAVIIIGGLFTILCIYMALADWPVSA